MRSRLLSVSQIGSYLAKESASSAQSPVLYKVPAKIIRYAQGNTFYINFKSIQTFCIKYSIEWLDNLFPCNINIEEYINFCSFWVGYFTKICTSVT